MKERSFGSKSSVTSMVKRMGGGAPVQWVRGMVWDYGKQLRRSGIIWVVGWPTKWVMGREWDSGWINGVEMSHFVSPSLPYLPFLHLRKLGWRMFGTRMVMGVDGPPFFSRAFNAWELELVTHFLQKIHAFRVENFIKVSCLSGWKLALHLKVKCLSLRHTTFWKKKIKNPLNMCFDQIKKSW